MLELAADLLPLLGAGETVAVVTVTRVARSAPRGAGAAMAVTREARVIGSISGGCVESDAVALALASLHMGRGAASRFGFSDAQAFEAGLACGGSVDAVVSVLRPDDEAVRDALRTAAGGGRAAIGVVAGGPEAGRILAAADLGLATDAAGDTRILPMAHEGADVVLVAARPAPRLIVLGAGEHAAALCRVGRAAGFAVTICDVWATLVTPERFPDAAELVVETPADYLESLGPDRVDERTAVCVLTHDVRLDVPALAAALRMPIGFVGAMGARSTVARRAEMLRDAGVDDEALARLHSPLGLDLGGITPEHTALAVLAEIVAAAHGGSGTPLHRSAGPLHRRHTAADARQAPAASC